MAGDATRRGDGPVNDRFGGTATLPVIDGAKTDDLASFTFAPLLQERACLNMLGDHVL